MKKVAHKRLLDYAKTLNNHTRQIWTYLDVYKNLLNELNSKKMVFQETPILFTMLFYSLEDSIMIGISKLFDKSEGVMSICTLYDLCKQDRKLFPSTRLNENGSDSEIPYNIDNVLLIAQADLIKYQPVIANIKKRRNKLWAHSDKKFIFQPDELKNEYPIVWGDIENLLLFASDFTNTIILGFTNSICAPYFVTPNACKQNVKHMVALMEQSIKLEDKNESYEI